MIGNAIYEILSNDAGVSALIGDKIYPVLIDQQKVFPAAVYQVTSGQGTPGKGEASQMDSVNIQVDCYSVDYDEAATIALAVRSALENYGGTVLTVKISNVEWNGTVSAYAENPELFRFKSSYLFTVKN